MNINFRYISLIQLFTASFAVRLVGSSLTPQQGRSKGLGSILRGLFDLLDGNKQYEKYKETSFRGIFIPLKEVGLELF